MGDDDFPRNQRRVSLTDAEGVPPSTVAMLSAGRSDYVRGLDDASSTDRLRRESLRRVYFARRSGVWPLWEVWWRWEDGACDFDTGYDEWRALWGVRFWLKLNAIRAAADLGEVYLEGLYG